MKTIFTLFLVFVVVCIYTINVAAQTDSLKITYDATKSGDSCQALGVAKMYMQSGAGVSSPLSAWEYGRGHWGIDDGIGLMTKMGTNLWTITIHVYDYYGGGPSGPIPQGATVYGIGMYFGPADGSIFALDDNCQDIFVRQVNTANLVVQNSDGTSFAGVTAEWVGGTGINDHGSISAVNTYPNPFSNATTITYTLNAYAKDFSVSIYNIMGQEVARLYSGAQTAGAHTISWDGTNGMGKSLESGVYFFTLNDGSGQLTKKLMLAR